MSPSLSSWDVVQCYLLPGWLRGEGGGGRVRGIHPMNHASYRWRIPSFPHLMHPQAIIGQIISVLSRRLFNKTKEF